MGCCKKLQIVGKAAVLDPREDAYGMVFVVPGGFELGSDRQFITHPPSTTMA